MLYRKNPVNQKELSILGYGCLRFSKKGKVIDQEKAEEEMRAAIERGVNYFDTAYTYGGSEVCLGKFLAKGYRDKVNIATKLPHYFIKKEGDMERYFMEELKRLQTDHLESGNGLRRKRPKGRLKILVFHFTAVRRISRRFWMHMTGISARFSIIIWMNILRREGEDFSMRMRRVCP